MLNNSFTKTNTIFGQALGCTALDDAFVKLLSDVNADGVTQFLVRTNGEEKMKTVAQSILSLWKRVFVSASLIKSARNMGPRLIGIPLPTSTSPSIRSILRNLCAEKVSVVRRMSKSCAFCSLTLIATAKTHQLTSATASVNLYWMP